MKSPQISSTSIIKAAMLAVTAAWIIIIYHWFGNTTDVERFSRSVFKWMVERWSDANFAAGGYSLGWLLPVVSLYDIWRKRSAIADAEKSPYPKALLLIAFALFLHWAAARAQQPRLSLMSLLMVSWGSVLYIYGKPTAKLLLFPFGYLIFCIPFNFLDSLTFPLRMISTSISAALLNGIGIPVDQIGSAIISSEGRFHLDVADPCSGIKSMLTMAALATAYAYFFTEGKIKRTLIAISSVPIAMASNILRIISLGTLAQATSQETAMGFYHTFSGYVLFITAILLLILVSEVIERVEKMFKREKTSGRN